MAQRKSVTVNGVTWYYSGSPAAWPSMTLNVKVTGQSGVNTQFSGDGDDTMTGGGGGSDNIFYVNSNDIAVAGLGDGIDTIISYWGTLALPAGFTDGVMNGPGVLTANSGNDILTAQGSGAQTIVGGSGDDLMIGSATGQDRYIVDGLVGGSAVIMSFKHGADVLQLSNYAQFTNASLATVEAAMTQQGTSVVLALGGGHTVTFANQTISQFTAKDFALPSAPTGWKMTFDDEFNTLSASASGNGTTWQFQSGTRAANDEAENYLPSSGPGSPFSIANGVLDITASPVSTAPGLPYTSGGLTTARSFSQTYGYFEIRAEMPAGAGMWPAFWLLPADGSWPPELDAPEVLGSNPNTIYFSTHSTLQASQTVAVSVPNTSTGFHTYGVDWEPATITYYFDGVAVASLPTPADMDKPMYLLLELAVGGKGSWPGAATGETGQLLVDYIRAYASPTAVQPALVLTGWGMAINKGDGSYSITGAGGGGTITLGNGNQTIVLSDPPGSADGAVSGSQNKITLGNGNQTVTTLGNSNIITTGAGTSVINAGVSYNHITVGATASGTTVLSATGYGDVFTSTGAGNVSVSGATGNAQVNLAGGNQAVTLGGSGNTVTVGNGNSIIVGGTGQDSVHTGAGNSSIAVIGYNNVLDAGAGNNSLSGGYGSDVFILNGAGQGEDVISNFHVANHDMLDFSRALSGLGVSPSAASLSAFVTAAASTGGTMLSIDTSGRGGAGVAVALLSGVNTSVASLLANNDIRLNATIL